MRAKSPPFPPRRALPPPALTAAARAALSRSDDFARYEVKPLASYGDLTTAVAGLNLKEKEEDEHVSILFLNCGGNVDLHTYLEDDEGVFPSKVRLYVADSHRPLHLNNVYEDPSKILLFDDGTTRPEDFPAMAASDEDESSSGLGDSSDDADGLDSDSDVSGSTYYSSGDEREHLAGGTVDDATPPSDDSDSDSVADDGGELLSDTAKRSRSEAGAGSRRRKKRRSAHSSGPMTVRKYYRATSYGGCISGLMYQLAVNLARDRTDFLWYAIVGLTDQFVHKRISRAQYDLEAELLCTAVQAQQKDDQGATTEAEVASEVVAAPDSKMRIVVAEDELRLMLMRHWSIYESMYHSDYFATRLGIWKAAGREKLHAIFALTGVPLVEVRQKFKSMDPDMLQKFETQIAKQCESFGLDDITFGSFHKVHGLRLRHSASDIVYAASAMLESADGLAAAAADAQLASSGVSASPWEERFWMAYDMLSSTDEYVLNRGIERAIAIQRATVAFGSTIVESFSKRPASKFRYAFLAPNAQSHIFLQPLALGKLAQYVVDTLAALPNVSRKPLIIFVPNEANGTYLLLGTMCAVGNNDVQKNTFGTAFRHAAEATKSRVRHDGFETSWMEIQKEDAEKFLTHLNYGTWAG